MFQSFDAISAPDLAAPRVAGLRRLMGKRDLAAYLVPRADEHQGEYVPPSAERLKWLTGFSGSAGLAIIAARRAVVLVDGRYTVQARSELDPALFEIAQTPRVKAEDWLAEALPAGGRVGFDPRLFTLRTVETLSAALVRTGQRLVPVAGNLVDRVWAAERPAAPAGPVRVHDVSLAGEAAADKIARVQDILAADGEDAAVLTLPDSIAWLFNIRGADIPHNPVALAFAIVPRRGKPELFIDAAKLDAAARAHLKPLAKIAAPAGLDARLAEMKSQGRKVRLDPGTAAFALARQLGGRKHISPKADPVIALKAVKNGIEIAGARAAHIRDGVAVTRFLAWLDGAFRARPDHAASAGDLDEIGAARRLEAFRAETGELREISFDTIAGAGPNGAIVHYRVNAATNRTLRPGDLFLIDSGAQYADGTTDITRTIAIGQPTSDMIRAFTMVLKGHIAIATARFPKGTRGIDLDPFARRALWQAGLDFDHGTGHGVGSYLSVHEGPASISRAGMVALEPGMILSNEPGYYREGGFGIRIENLVLVRPFEVPAGGERAMASLETLTLAPIDRRLIDTSLLSAEERVWLDRYHARVAETLSPHLDTATRRWLAAATAPL
ncbi:MAG: aminopeptidase P family protein [Hyphomicrobiaceae bacterium]|nr:aminopeptidase P family protein [Hyphomicrobiaceae bacterium]